MALVIILSQQDLPAYLLALQHLLSISKCITDSCSPTNLHHGTSYERRTCLANNHPSSPSCRTGKGPGDQAARASRPVLRPDGSHFPQRAQSYYVERKMGSSL